MTNLDQVIADMLRAGATYDEISAQLGVGRPVITAIRKAHENPVPKGRGGSGTDPEYIRRRDQEIADLLRQGVSGAEISRRLRVSTTTITNVRKTEGMGRPSTRTPTVEEEAERQRRHKRAAQMLRAGATYRQITAETGLSPSTVSIIRKANRLPPRRRSSPATGT